MRTPSTSDVIMRSKNYPQIVIDIFRKYADEKFESKFFWKALKLDFKDWIKEH